MPPIEDAVVSGEAPAAAEVPPPTTPADPKSPVYAVLLAAVGKRRRGQVVFGDASAIADLGDRARPATPDEISISAPSHFPLEP